MQRVAGGPWVSLDLSLTFQMLKTYKGRNQAYVASVKMGREMGPIFSPSCTPLPLFTPSSPFPLIFNILNIIVKDLTTGEKITLAVKHLLQF